MESATRGSQVCVKCDRDVTTMDDCLGHYTRDWRQVWLVPYLLCRQPRLTRVGHDGPQRHLVVCDGMNRFVTRRHEVDAQTQQRHLVSRLGTPQNLGKFPGPGHTYDSRSVWPTRRTEPSYSSVDILCVTECMLFAQTVAVVLLQTHGHLWVFHNCSQQPAVWTVDGRAWAATVWSQTGSGVGRGGMYGKVG